MPKKEHHEEARAVSFDVNAAPGVTYARVYGSF
jgi:hypothetical protein